MDEKLLLKLNCLKKLIKEDSRLKRLNDLEKKMNECEDVIKLSYRKEMCCIEFEDALSHYGEAAKETKKAQKCLYEAKLSLDNHPLCKEYMEAYLEVKKLYNLINKEIFKPFFDKYNFGDAND